MRWRDGVDEDCNASSLSSHVGRRLCDNMVLIGGEIIRYGFVVSSLRHSEVCGESSHGPDQVPLSALSCGNYEQVPNQKRR